MNLESNQLKLPKKVNKELKAHSHIKIKITAFFLFKYKKPRLMICQMMLNFKLIKNNLKAKT